MALVAVSILSWIALLPAVALAIFAAFLVPASFGWQPTFEWLLMVELPVLILAVAVCKAAAAKGRMRAILAGSIVVVGVPTISALFFLT